MIGRLRANVNSDPQKLERVKILFQFLLMLICSAIIGYGIAKNISEDFYQSSMLGVSAHFETVFLNCNIFYDYLKTVLIYAVSDILSILIIFVISFSAFNYIVSDILLIYNGLRMGFSISFLSVFVSNALFGYNIGVLRYTAFVFFKAVALTLIFDYAYRAAVYSLKFKIITPNGRPNVKIKVLFPFVVYTLTYIGSVIIINGAYCWLIYFLK